MKTKNLGFIGGGRITRILLQGFINKNALPEKVVVYEPDKNAISALQKVFPKVQVTNSPNDAALQDLVFIAVHPPAVMESLKAIKDVVSSSTVVISLAPKIGIDKMASVLPTNKLIRMIPNATSVINEGFNPVIFAAEFEKNEKTKILTFLENLGETFETEESKLESYAIISAMLPTYFWFQWKEMELIALKTGLTEDEAKNAVSSTLEKALKLYYNSDLNPEEVMDLIPVKPIGDHESGIKEIFHTKLMGLFEKIKS